MAISKFRRRAILVVLLVVMVPNAASCGDTQDVAESVPVPTEPEAGEPASWTTDPAAPPSPKDTSLAVLVTGVACSGGQSTPILRPGVEFTDSKIEITFNAAPPETLPGQTLHTCQGTQPAPYTVQLGQEVGDRPLVDGICKRATHIADSAFCKPSDGVRWPPRS